MSASSGRDILELASAVKRARRVPDGSMCSVCTTRDHLAIRPNGEVRCYAHFRSDEVGTELDHWVGKAVLDYAVIRLHANAHRQITELRRLIGVDDLPSLDGDPLLLLAHLLAAFAALLMLFADWLAQYAGALRSDRPAPFFPVVP